MAQPQELTYDEFVRIFGMSPKEYEQAHPDRVTTNVRGASPQAPRTRRYGQQAQPQVPSETILPQIDVRESDEIRNAVAPLIAGRKDSLRDKGNEKEFVGDPNVLMPDFLESAQANVIASALSIPTSIAGFADLVRIGIPAIANGIMSDDEEKSTYEAIAEEFSNGVISPEASAQLEALQLSKVDEFRASNPSATQDDIIKFLKEYNDSDEFFDEVTNRMSGGFALAQRGQTWANMTAGLGKRADQMTAGDDAMQAIAGAFVGIPASTARMIGKRIASAVGERVSQNVIARTSAKVLEAVTPITLPLTPTNVAINAAAGVAIGEGVRELTDSPTLFDYQQLYNPEEVTKPENLAAASGITAAAIFSMPALMRGIRDKAADAVNLDPNRIGQNAGPTIAEQSDQLTPQLSPTTGLLDETSPITHAAQKFGADEDTIADLIAARSGASTVNRVQSENNAYNYGMLENMPDTVPMAHIVRANSRLDKATQDVLDKYIYAVQRKQDAAIYEESLLKQIHTKQTAVMAQGGRRIRKNPDGTPKLSKDEQELVELQQKYARLQADDRSTRSSMQDWTRADVETFIKAGEANPQVREIAEALRKISSDRVDYQHKNGLISAEEAARRKKSRPLHVTLQEARYAGRNALTRRALLFKDKFRKPDTDQEFFVSTTPRDVTGEGAAINQPRSAIIAAQDSLFNDVRAVTVNNARRDSIRQLAALPNALGRLLRPYEFNVGNRKTTSISPDQFAAVYGGKIKNQERYVQIFDNGNIEFWEFGDPSITRSLQFAPLSSIPIMHETRKIWQSMTTGTLAPWFAPKNMIWDMAVGRATKQAGRSFGMLDTLARRLTEGTALERPVAFVADNLFDPTVVASVIAAVPRQLYLRAAKAVGDKVATDLATHSGIFNSIAESSPQGAEFVKAIGRYGATAFDNSALAVMSRNMSTSLSHMNDVSTIYDDFSRAASMSGRAAEMALAPIQAYKAILESMHFSARYAFFAENWGRLQAKYGVGNVPKREERRLIQETRELSGDMSRQSNSKFIQDLTSAVPYANATIQGTRHILSSAIPQPIAKGINRVAGGNILEHRDTRFWSQMITGLLIPKIGALAFLSNWEGAEDHWFNRTPSWEQMSYIPMPKPEVLIEMAETGQLPEFSPDKLHKVPVAPEYVLFLEPATAMMRAMGIIGTPKVAVPPDAQNKLKEVIDHVTSFATPPTIAAFFAAQGKRLDLHGAITMQGGLQDIPNNTHGGANADMMTNNSIIPKAVYESIGALMGSAMQIAMQTFNVFEISYAESESFIEAASDAFDTASFEVSRRLPNVPSGGLWKSRTRLYSFTPESQYVYETLNDLAPVIGSGRQRSVEHDRNDRESMILEQGLVPANKLRDPNLRNIMELVHSELNQKGPFKAAKEQNTEIRALLSALESSRYKMKDDTYNKRRNIYVQRQQDNIRVQSQELQRLERQITQTVGDSFQKQYGVPFSYKNFANLVRKDVSRR